MKLFNILTAGLLLCAGLASCEMKDELKGSGEGTSEVGYLDLGVAVNASQNNVSRADVDDDGENVGVSVSADDFPVIITGITDTKYLKEYESYAALKAENEGKVELPVGEYTVTAHSDAELQPQMAAPYYEGTASIKITAGVESSASVECTMKNMKIQIRYTDNFRANFTSWDITINDGTNNLYFDETDKNPAAIYWLVAENQSKLSVEITAVNGDGETVHESRELTKPEGGNSANWTGGDALTITMEESTPTPDNPSGIQGSGITINASVSFDEEEEDVPVTVKPGNDGDDDNKEPEPPTPTPEPELPTVTFPQNTYTLPADASKNADAVITSTAEGGIQSVKVQIVGGNDGFADITSTMGFADGLELVGNTDLGPVISAIVQGLEMPQAGDTSYTFPVGGFFNILQQMGATTAEGGHVFNITVTDANGTASESLSVKVTE